MILLVNFFLNLLGDEVLQLPPKHGQFADPRWGYVHSGTAGHQENGLFPAKLSVDDTHRELTVEIGVRPNASYLKEREFRWDKYRCLP